MDIVSLAEIKAQVGLTDDQDHDDLMLQQKIDAATSHVERLLGFTFADRFETREAVPPALHECVLQLASWWYENREAVSDVSKSLPFGVTEIVNEHRDWAF